MLTIHHYFKKCPHVYFMNLILSLYKNNNFNILKLLLLPALALFVWDIVFFTVYGWWCLLLSFSLLFRVRGFLKCLLISEWLKNEPVRLCVCQVSYNICSFYFLQSGSPICLDGPTSIQVRMGEEDSFWHVCCPSLLPSSVSGVPTRTFLAKFLQGRHLPPFAGAKEGILLCFDWIGIRPSHCSKHNMSANPCFSLSSLTLLSISLSGVLVPRSESSYQHALLKTWGLCPAGVAQVV